MAILNFPNTRYNGDPLEIGDTYTGDNGVVYTYDGAKWSGRNISTIPTSNAIVNGGYVVQVDTGGNLFTPSYIFPNTSGSEGQVLTWPASGTILEWTNQSGSGGGVSISDFGEGFSLTGANKIVTNKLYSTNQTQPTQHYRLELDTNGVIHLPDQSIINGATLKTVPGNYAGITAGPIGADEDSWVWVDNSGATIATKYSSDQHLWTFDNNGNLTFPQGTTLGYSDPGGFIIDGAVNKDVSIYTYGSDTPNGWIFNTSSNLTIPGDIRDANGSVIRIATTSTAPTRVNGQLWFNTIDGRAYIRYNDNWIDLSPTEVPSPSTYLDGLTIDGTTISTVDTTATTIYLEGDLIPTLNNTYDLGSVDRQWKSLYVSTGTIYIGGTPLSIDAGGNLTVAGNPVSGALTSDQGLVTFPGNFLIGTLWPDGVDKESVVWAKDDTEYLGLWWGGDQIYPTSNYGPVAGIQIGSDVLNIDDFTNTPTAPGTGITIGVNDSNLGNTLIWTFENNGKLTTAGTVQMAPGGRFITDGSTGVTSSQWYNFPNAANQGIIRVFSDEGTTEKAAITLSNLADINIQNTYKWIFGNDGSLTLPSGAGFAKGDSGILKTNDGTTQALDFRDITGAGFYTDTPGYVLRSNGSNNWTFGRDGNLTIPTSGDIIRNGSSVIFGGNLTNLGDVSVGGVANGQVLTYLSAIGKWVPTTGNAGGAGSTGYYASFYSTGTYNVTTSTSTNVRINGTFESNGINIINGYQITFINSGTYLLNYAIQVKNTDTQNRDIDIWFKVNDIDVPNSNTKFTISAAALDGDPGKLLAVSPLTITASPSDKVSIACIAESNTISIFEQSASVSPAIPYTPSAIITAGLVFYKGEIGPQGDIGYTGSRGDIGYTGSAGTQGNIGYTGSTGTVGYTGSAGTQGITGSTGTQGNVGYTGSTGTQGNVGYTGSTGTQGNIGYTGSAGSFNGTVITTTATFASTLTTAVSTNTGILQVQGGLGVSGNVYANTVYSNDGYFRGPTGYGSIQLASGGAIYADSIVLNGTGLIKGPAGYLNITLNSGWSGAVRFASTATVGSTSNSTTSTNGALIVSGGAGIAGNTYVGGYVAQAAKPAFRVIGNGGAISALSTLTNANWVMDYNQGNYLNTSTGYFTAPVAGIYQINLVMRTNSNSSSTIAQAIVIKTVGTFTLNLCMLEFGANTTMNHAGVSTAAKLAVGDTVKVVVAVGTLSFDSNDNWSIAFLG